MAKKKVLLVPVAALFACFSFSAVASPLVAARADDAVANVAAGCVESQYVFTSLNYEFTMEAMQHIWGEPPRLGVSALAHQFNLSSSGTSASQSFNLTGGVLIFGDTSCSIGWSDPSAPFNMFPHCEKEKTSGIYNHTWAAYEMCPPGTDHSEPTLVVTPVFENDVSKLLTFISSRFLPQNQIYFTRTVANPPPSLHRQFTRFFLTAKKPTPLKRTPLDATVADSAVTVADSGVPQSAAACVAPPIDDFSTLKYNFTLNAIQIINGKVDTLDVSLHNFSPGFDLMRLCSGGSAPAVFNLGKGILSSRSVECGITRPSQPGLNSNYPVPYCGKDTKPSSFPGQTWEARYVCLPDQLKPTLLLLPLFEKAVKAGSHWGAPAFQNPMFKDGSTVMYVVGSGGLSYVLKVMEKT